jgi:hypothetical protein
MPTVALGPINRPSGNLPLTPGSRSNPSRGSRGDSVPEQPAHTDNPAPLKSSEPEG